MPNPAATVAVFPREDIRGVDTLDLHAEGLRPNTTFAVFLTQMPVPPFGAVQYIGDFTTNAAGRGSVRVDAIIDEAFAFNNITGVRTDLNHIVFWFADPADDEDCVPGSAPGHFDGDGSPESRRCLRRIFFLARHSRNTEARLLSLAESGSALIGASLPRMARGSLLRIKNGKPKNERNDSHENSNHLFTSHHFPFPVRFHSRRAYAWCVCTCVGPEDFRGCSGARRRLSRRQYRRG